jgi:hypothetical protein
MVTILCHAHEILYAQAVHEGKNEQAASKGKDDFLQRQRNNHDRESNG